MSSDHGTRTMALEHHGIPRMRCSAELFYRLLGKRASRVWGPDKGAGAGGVLELVETVP
jgi:hypothetical protein